MYSRRRNERRQASTHTPLVSFLETQIRVLPSRMGDLICHQQPRCKVHRPLPTHRPLGYSMEACSGFRWVLQQNHRIPQGTHKAGGVSRACCQITDIIRPTTDHRVVTHQPSRSWWQLMASYRCWGVVSSPKGCVPQPRCLAWFWTDLVLHPLKGYLGRIFTPESKKSTLWKMSDNVGPRVLPLSRSVILSMIININNISVLGGIDLRSAP